jgi:hypothetical protein
MQEPAEEAAAIMRANWDSRFSCGPGYILGDVESAHVLAIAGDRRGAGVPLMDIGRTSWFDPGLLQREGAIVAFRTPIPTDSVGRALPGVSIRPEPPLTLPLLRTWADETVTYNYFFVAPASCGSATLPPA